MIHWPAASITSTLRRSSSSTSGGSAPTLLIRSPQMTIASLRPAGWPEPSIKVPLRITRVFAALMVRPPCAKPIAHVGRSYPQTGRDVRQIRPTILRRAILPHRTGAIAADDNGNLDI